MSKILLKRTSVKGRVPTTAQLDLGELAVNTNDGGVFYKTTDGGEKIVRLLTSSDLAIAVSDVVGNYLPLTGGKLTGSLEIEGGGINPKTSGKTASDPLGSYPMGISVVYNGHSTLPSTTGELVTVQESAARNFQLFHKKNSNEISIRHWNDGSSALPAGWSGWDKFFTTENLSPVETTRSITAGNGLTGGGDLSANRSIALGTPGTLTASTSNAVTATSHTHALNTTTSYEDTVLDRIMKVGDFGIGRDNGTVTTFTDAASWSKPAGWSGIIRDTSVGQPFSGFGYYSVLAKRDKEGGYLGFCSSYSTGDIWFETRSDNTALPAWKKLYHTGNLSPAETSTQIIAGNGLSGGGTLSANRTITLGTPGTLTATTTNSVSATSHTHSLNTQTSTTDTTSGRLLTVGAFGLGVAVDLGTSDLNTITISGIYSQTGSSNATTARNYPITNSGNLLVMAPSGNTSGITQQYHCVNNGRIFTRELINSVWQPWVEVYHSGSPNVVARQVNTGASLVGTASADLIYSRMADNDVFRLKVGGTATNAGFVELGTADDASEPIYVRQYQGTFATLTRSAALLDELGNTTFPGDITAFYSDERLKDKVSNITNARDIINRLNGFYYKENELAESFGYHNNHIQIGLSAQEVQKVLPELVTAAPFDRETDPDNPKTYRSRTGENYLTVKYERMVPVLVEAIKEQDEIIVEQKYAIEELKETTENLQSQIDSLRMMIESLAMEK